MCFAIGLVEVFFQATAAGGIGVFAVFVWVFIALSTHCQADGRAGHIKIGP